jgi:hypothetical protein
VRSKTSKDYHALARQRGFVWLGPLPASVLVPTRWRCPNGHTWRARYHHLRQGTGCPLCARTARKTAAHYRALARQRGFAWTGRLPVNTHTRTTWRCAQGHGWRATFSSVSGGSGCPHCAGVAPRTAAGFRALGRQVGFVWLGPVTPSHNSTRWRCPHGHEWLARAGTLSGGHGCPICAVQRRRKRPVVRS